MKSQCEASSCQLTVNSSDCSLGNITLLNTDINTVTTNSWRCNNSAQDQNCLHLRLFNQQCSGIETVSITLVDASIVNGDNDQDSIFLFGVKNSSDIWNYLVLINDWAGKLGNINAGTGGVYIAPHCGSSSLLSTDDMLELWDNASYATGEGFKAALAGGDVANYDTMTDESVGPDIDPLNITIVNNLDNNTVTVIFDEKSLNEKASCRLNQAFDTFESGNDWIILAMPDQGEVDYKKFIINSECTQLQYQHPTVLPSDNPTTIPSIIPTIWPSDDPSTVPSKIPAKIPSIMPTDSPILSPTTIPSSNPTTIPSNIATRAPSIVPSSIPSTIPTSLPSIMPTELSTLSPSVIPSVIPSSTSTTIPSKIPTRIPSIVPTPLPITTPSGEPTTIPFTIPTRTPIILQSSSPTHVETTIYNDQTSQTGQTTQTTRTMNSVASTKEIVNNIVIIKNYKSNFSFDDLPIGLIVWLVFSTIVCFCFIMICCLFCLPKNINNKKKRKNILDFEKYKNEFIQLPTIRIPKNVTKMQIISFLNNHTELKSKRTVSACTDNKNKPELKIEIIKLVCFECLHEYRGQLAIGFYYKLCVIIYNMIIIFFNGFKFDDDTVTFYNNLITCNDNVLYSTYWCIFIVFMLGGICCIYQRLIYKYNSYSNIYQICFVFMINFLLLLMLLGVIGTPMDCYLFSKKHLNLSF